MRRLICAVGVGWGLVAGLVGSAGVARADEAAQAIIARGIAALGGEAKLAKATALKWKAEGKLTLDGNDNDFSIQYTTQGLDHSRAEFEGEFNGNEVKGMTVLDGNKGWRSFGETNPLDADAVDNEKRNAYLQVVPITLLPLKDKAFKTELAGEEKVNDKPASVVKVTGPDGKSFRLLFDKESGLPTKMTATVVGFGGDDYEQVSFYRDFKEMDGIKKAMALEVLRDGNPFLKVTIKEFKLVDKLPADTFAEPK